MKTRSWKFVLAAVSLSWGGLAHAGLIDRGNGLIYDTVLDITWMQNANYCYSSEGSSNPACSASAAGRWDRHVLQADQLVYAGFDDWRLASVSVAAGIPVGMADSAVDCNTATEEQCRDNELGYMYYYNLSNLAGPQKIGDVLSVDGVSLYNIWYAYDAGVRSTFSNDKVWAFAFTDGSQWLSGNFCVCDDQKPWFVREGDVFAVPTPSTLLLLGVGLAGLGRVRRWRSQ